LKTSELKLRGMKERELRKIYQQFRRAGCFLDWEEWKEKVTRAYPELIKVARQRSLITYGELGLGKLGISPDWLHPKIGWIVGACSEYEWLEGRPLISSIVINADTKRPGKGFWGLSGIPKALSYDIDISNAEPVSKDRLEFKRDEFWTKEVAKVYEQWQERE